MVILYNLKNKQPLMFFNRTVGGHIGWPDSKTWKSQAWNKLKNELRMRRKGIEDLIEILRKPKF